MVGAVQKSAESKTKPKLGGDFFFGRRTFRVFLNTELQLFHFFQPPYIYARNAVIWDVCPNRSELVTILGVAFFDDKKTIFTRKSSI